MGGGWKFERAKWKNTAKKTIEVKLQVEEVNKKLLEIKKTRQKYNVARLEDLFVEKREIMIEELNFNDLEDLVLRMKKKNL